MKKLLIALGFILLLVAIIFASFSIYINNVGIPYYEVTELKYQHTSNPEIVARGKKLALMLCAACHTNSETGKLTGQKMLEMPEEFGTIRSKNITQDLTHGIGKWTDGEILHFLRTGINKEGRYVPPYMPKLTVMADEDVNAIIAFLRSDDPMVAADPTPDPDSEPSFMVKALSNIAWKPYPLPEKSIPFPDTTDQVALGKYYAHNMDCYACHSKDFKSNDYQVPENSKGYFGGGNNPLNSKGQIIKTSNLTPHPTYGIGNWTEEQFVKAVRFGLKDGEAPLRKPMFPFTHLSNYEVASIYQYLMTLDPIENEVEREFYD